MRSILEEEHSERHLRDAPKGGFSTLDALLWTLLAGEFGLFVYLLMTLSPDKRKEDA